MAMFELLEGDGATEFTFKFEIERKHKAWLTGSCPYSSMMYSPDYSPADHVLDFQGDKLLILDPGNVGRSLEFDIDIYHRWSNGVDSKDFKVTLPFAYHSCAD